MGDYSNDYYDSITNHFYYKTVHYSHMHILLCLSVAIETPGIKNFARRRKYVCWFRGLV